MQKLPTIRRSRCWIFLPTIRRSQFGFFAESYRRSDDQISVFLPKVTDDPTITFRFFCRKVPTIRRSLFGFFPESYRRSDDQISVFLPKITDDPTITFRFFSRKLTTIRWSNFGFLLKITDDPMITFGFFPRSYLIPGNRHFQYFSEKSPKFRPPPQPHIFFSYQENDRNILFSLFCLLTLFFQINSKTPPTLFSNNTMVTKQCFEICMQSMRRRKCACFSTLPPPHRKKKVYQNAPLQTSNNVVISKHENSNFARNHTVKRVLWSLFHYTTQTKPMENGY